MRFTTAILASLLLISAAYAQSKPSLPKTGGTVSLDFHDVDISDVVKAISEITGKNFILDDHVRGKVTIISPNPVTIEEAYQAFISALRTKGLTTVDTGKVTKIIPEREAPANPVPFLSGNETNYGDQVVTRLIPLQFISANEIRQALNGMVSRTGSIVAYGPTNALILTDSASNISRLMKIIQKLDKQGFQSSVEIIPLKFAQADDIADKLTTIFEKEKTTSTRRRSDDVAGGDAISKIIPDMRTNSLVVMATREGLGRVLDIVGELDRKVEIALDRGRIHVKYLKHANAEELGDLLGNLLTGQGAKKKKEKKQTSAEKRGFGQAAPLPWESQGESSSGDSDSGRSNENSSFTSAKVKEGGSAQLFESEVRVVADTSINALVITASPNDYTTIEPIIEQLDVRRPQVFVEALIMEVNISKTVDVGLSGGGGGQSGSMSMFGMTNLSAASPLGLAGLGGKAAGEAAGAMMGQGQGLVLGGFSRQTVQIPGTNVTIPIQGAVFRALQQQGAVNVLSAPNILTADNKKAEILVGQDVPMKTNEYADTQGKPVTNFSRQKIGIQLSVTPQINEGDEVTLEIEQKIQDLIPDSKAMFGDVASSERTAKTTVIAQNGQTIVIGGLIKDKDSKTVSKVPLLGDIPVLGYLFRQTAVSKEKINLMIFLTPHVIHEPADMTRVSVRKNAERRRFNKVQGIGENRALYDYDLESGLNMAPPPKKSEREDVKPKRRYNLDRLDDEETKPSTSDEEVVQRRPSGRVKKTETVQSDFQEDEEQAPRPRRGSKPPSSKSAGNPFSDVRPPSSN
ncbi:MAG: type II secretion system secretin GspD [Pseudomonadota bacterium]